MALDEIKRQHESKTELQKMQRKIAPQGSTSTAPNTGNRISLGTKYDNLDSKSTEAQKSELRAKLFKESGGSLPSSSVYSQGSSTLQSKAPTSITAPVTVSMTAKPVCILYYQMSYYSCSKIFIALKTICLPNSRPKLVCPVLVR